MNFTDKLKDRLKEKNEEQVFDNGEKEFNETFEKSPFYGIEQVRNMPSCIDFRFRESYKAVPYSFILEISYDPSEGIEITTTTKKILITGRNLKLLYSYLTSFRVRFIQENIGNDLTEEKALFVKDIKIEEL